MKKNTNLSKQNKVMVCSVVFAVIINLVLPFCVKPFATKNQIMPPNGAASLPFFDQLIHMLVHHAQVPFTSSIIVAIIVALSMCLGNRFCFI